ncbi:hypothetical protein [Trinickia dabaoshanensis]|uniref:hypothetical protein n=1 Tax=Trinickia dabaoshanensis TaxID=564714 RepID=UPI0018EC0144|nr:hypothetical protein [Trinickia dabaoshanensis]
MATDIAQFARQRTPIGKAKDSLLLRHIRELLVVDDETPVLGRGKRRVIAALFCRWRLGAARSAEMNPVV